MVATLAIATSTPARAQDVTGTISGRVSNVRNGTYLSKARVAVEGTSIETFTNDFGEYVLRGVPAGPARVTATFTGMQPVTAAVVVTAGGTSTQNLEFNTEDVKRTSDGQVVLDPFIVESERYKNAAEIAINEERFSPTIKNVISADAFGDITDGNIGEFVKYVPGVQVDYGYSNGAGNAADNNATSISVRGFGPEFTSITVDGVPLTNASPATLTRAIGLDMMTLNNASRVEVIKVATPDMPSDSPGGSVNIITRSAFEYARPTLNWRVSLNVNSEDMDSMFEKTPGPANKSTYKTLPGFDASYVIPLNSTMGIAVSGAWSKTFNENHDAKLDHLFDTKDINSSSSFKVDLSNGGGPIVDRKGGGTTTTFRSIDGDELNIANPLLYRFQALDTPNTVTRMSGSLRFDWHPSSNQTFSIGYTYGDTSTVDAQRRLQFNADKSYYMDWGPDFATSYKFIPKGTVVNGKAISSDFNPKATVAQTVTTRDRSGTTHTGYLRYALHQGPWTVNAKVSESRSRGSYQDMDNGHFSEVETDLSAGQLMFKGIHEGIPGTIEVYDRKGSPLDWANLANWAAPDIQAKSGITESLDERRIYSIDVRRELDFLPWDWMTVGAKAGFYREEQREKKWGLGTGFRMTYYGPELALTDYMDDGYSGQTPGFGLPGQQWVSTYKLYQLWQDNPTYFNDSSDEDQGNNWNSYVNQQKSITETSDQYYFMLDGKAMHGRLNWLAGVRQEVSTRKGYTPYQDDRWNFVRNADGSLYRDAANPKGVRIDQSSSALFKTDAAGNSLRAALNSAGISYPDHVISNSATGGTFNEYAHLRWIPFYEVDGKITGKPTPTASVAYNLTEQLTARVSWSRTQARPDFENGTLTNEGQSRGLQISEDSNPDAETRGKIIISNPDLKPWVSNSWDFQLAYYTKSGGKFAISPYYKTTKNFQETIDTLDSDPAFATVLEGYGLNPEDYQGYLMTTTVNGQGTAKTVGYELEARQNLRPLGDWGRYFDVWASFSHHYVKQNQTDKLSAKPLSGSTASWGLSFSAKRFSALLRGLYLEEKYNGSQTVYTYNNVDYVIASYFPSSVQLDLNLRYQLSSRYSLFVEARNFVNESRDTIRYDKTGIVPDWGQNIERKEFGVTWHMGLSGSF